MSVSKAIKGSLVALFLIILVVQQVTISQLSKEAKRLSTAASAARKLAHQFSADLGRAEVEEGASQRSILKDIGRSFQAVVSEEIESLGLKNLRHSTAVVVNTSRGTAPPVRTTTSAPVEESNSPSTLPTTPVRAALTYSDWRLSASITEEGSLDYQLKQQFEIDIAEGESLGAKPIYISVYELDASGQKIVPALKVRSFVSKIEEVKAEGFKLFSPRLMLGPRLGLKGGRADIGGMIGVRLSSYESASGRDTIGFGGFFIDVDREGVAVAFSPAMYNLGPKTKVVDDFWLAPYLGLDLFAVGPVYGLSILSDF